MLDVIIAGAGPAGSIAALVLARAGARVLVVDREDFPRHKLCGDTLNPGALALLSSLGLTGGPLARARPLAGMLLTSSTARVAARYGPGVAGCALGRRELDAWLLDEAVGAGAKFQSGQIAAQALVEGPAADPVVRGLVLRRRGHDGVMRVPAAITIAADGRRSAVARSLDLIHHPARPRRWAFGAYATGVAGITDLGEMHIRSGHYIGIAPMPGSLVNVCVVTGPRPGGRAPMDVIHRAIDGDPWLRARFEQAEWLRDVQVLGPLATEARASGVNGLLLAGDAAGFVDPMTGDGLNLALRGGVLAAEAALAALQRGETYSAPHHLARARRAAFGQKVRFNRAMRRLVGSEAAVRVASLGAALAPGVFRRAVRYAGDL